MTYEIKMSATRMSSFLRCKQKYWFNYHDKLPKIANPVFKLGLAVHSALELAGTIWMEKESFSKKDIKIITDKYKEISVKEGLEDYSSHQEGLDMVKSRLKEFIAPGQKLIGLETPFGFPGAQEVITDEGVPLLGAIDKVVSVDEDTILIIDYKTSKTAPTPDQLKTDNQLSMYDLVASKLWPGKRIIVSLDLLKHDILYSYRTPEERAEFSEYLKLVYDAMVSLEESDVRATLNTFCPWCDYREYCDAYSQACKESNNRFQEIYRLDDNKLFEEWQHVKDMKKIFEMRDRELSMVLMDRIKTTGNNIQISDQEVYVRQNSRKEYDFDVVKQVVPLEFLTTMVSLNKKDLETYLDKNPAVKAKVTDSMMVNFTSPFLATRKIKQN
jgi:RecB family exonuclease